MSGQRWAPWDEPAEVSAANVRLHPAVVASSPPGPTQSLIALEGRRNSADAWIRCPASWLAVVLELRVELGGMVAIVDRAAVAQIDGARAASDGSVSGVMFSLRDRTFDQVELVAYPPGSELAAGGADFRLAAWTDHSVAGDRATQQPARLFSDGREDQHFDADLLAGANPVFGAPADGGRIEIARVVLTSTDAVSRLVELTDPTSGLVFGSWRTPTGGGGIVEPIFYPARFPRGAPADLVLSGLTLGSFVRASVTGYTR